MDEEVLLKEEDEEGTGAPRTRAAYEALLLGSLETSADEDEEEVETEAVEEDEAE